MGGIAVFIALLMLFFWLPIEGRHAVVRAGAITDITVHIILQGLLGGDSYGRLSMLFGGVMFNLFLHLYRKLRVKEKDNA